MLLRSCLSVVRETSQPSPRLPTIQSFGVLHVVQEDLVELRGAGHLLERPHVDAGLLHVDQQVGDAGVLLGLGLGAHEAEHVVRLLRRAGPDLLTVDDPLVADQLASRLEAREIAARAGLAVPLTPDHVTEDRRPDELLLHPLFAALEQRGDQHHRPDAPRLHRCVRTRELLADDGALQRVRRLLGAAVLLWNAAVQVARVRRLLAKASSLLLARPLRVCAGRRPARREEGLDLPAELFDFAAVAEIHASTPFLTASIGGRSSRENGVSGGWRPPSTRAQARPARPDPQPSPRARRPRRGRPGAEHDGCADCPPPGSRPPGDRHIRGAACRR